MMKIFIAPMLLALAAASPASPTVQIANGDWSELPLLDQVSYSHTSSALMTKLYEIGKQQKCRLPGLVGNHIDMTVSFAAQFEPDGKLSRLLVQPLNCPQAESWLGGTLVQAIEKGDFRPNPNNPNDHGWYRGQFSFYYEN